MEQYLGRRYKLKSSENFEEYLRYIGIGFFSRKTAIAVSPTIMMIRDDEGIYTYIMSSSLRSSVISFRPGEEFVEERVDGVKVKSIVTIEGNKFIQLQIEDNGRKSVHEREYVGDTLRVITTAEGWEGICVRTYELVY